ncbi:MAG: MoxR family ATPase [Oscillospiraceae bacterium]
MENDLEFNGMAIANNIIKEVKKAVIGKDQVIIKVLLAILAKGHILLEDIPGVGKTTLALAFSRAMQLDYNRVQFTPDVMPSDVTGYNVYKKASDSFEYVKGAVLCNLFLADEINRTSSKTQSALLQVMEEGKVTVDLKTYEVPKPFAVIATQNPTGHAGTQLLPESQLDRFIMRLSLGYPTPDDELSILKSKANKTPLNEINAVASAQDIISMQDKVSQIFVDDTIYAYAVCLVVKTRNNDLVQLGASPRGTISLINISRARAYLSGRDFVLPIDVQQAFIDTIAHRIILKPKAKVSNVTVLDILCSIMKTTPAPAIEKQQQ